MNTRSKSAVVLVSVLVLSALVHAADMEVWIRLALSEDPAVRTKAQGRLVHLGAKPVVPLFNLMDGEGQTVDKAAQDAVEVLVHHAAVSEDGLQKKISKALVEQLAGDGPIAVRRFAARMLSFVGGDEVVPALTGLLSDPEMGEMARWALVRIPGRVSLRALIHAFSHADADLKIALIGALVERRDPLALGPVRAALKDDSTAVRLAAVDALGCIPDPASIKFLRESMISDNAREREYAVDAYLRVADALGNPDLYRWLYDRAGTESRRCAALVGLAKTMGDESLPLLLEVMESPSEQLRGTARRALVDLEGPNMTTALGEALNTASGEARSAVVWALGKRGDPAAIEILKPWAKSRDEAFRSVVQTALTRLGERTDLPKFRAHVKATLDEIRVFVTNMEPDRPLGPTSVSLTEAPVGVRASDPVQDDDGFVIPIHVDDIDAFLPVTIELTAGEQKRVFELLLGRENRLAVPASFPGDGWFEMEKTAGRVFLATRRDMGQNYVYFHVDNEQMEDVNATVTLEVDFLALPPACTELAMMYDSNFPEDRYGMAGAYRQPETVSVVDLGDGIKRQTFLLRRAKFAGRQNGGSDFRVCFGDDLSGDAKICRIALKPNE